MERIAEKGEKTILAHLKHLKDHNEKEYLKIGIDYIKRNNLDVDLTSLHDNEPKLGCGCPGSMARTFNAKSLKPDVKPVFTANNTKSVL